jgi:hypothetical protein
LDVLDGVDDLVLVKPAAVFIQNFAENRVFYSRGVLEVLVLALLDGVPDSLRLGQGGGLAGNTLRQQAVNNHAHLEAEFGYQAFKDMLDPVLNTEINALMAILDALQHIAVFDLAKQ